MPTTPKIALFRSLALSLPGAIESAHQGHPDFRAEGRIFATLSKQAEGCGVLKLTVNQQQSFCTELPAIFSPVPGGWGRMGMTLVHLDHVDEPTLHGALLTAHRNITEKPKSSKAKPKSASTIKPKPRPRNKPNL